MDGLAHMFEALLEKGFSTSDLQEIRSTIILAPTQRAVSFISADFFQSIFWQKACLCHSENAFELFLPFKVAQTFSSFKESLWQKHLEKQTINQMRLGEAAIDFPQLLPSMIEAKLWERCAAMIKKEVVTDVPGAWFVNGYAALIQWDIIAAHPDWAKTEESKIFKEMIGFFEEICDQYNYIVASQLTKKLIEVDLEEIIFPIKKIILWNFLSLSPADQFFFEHLNKKYGIKISELKFSSFHKKDKNNTEKISFQSSEEEYQAAFSWAKERQLNKPGEKLAIVMPHLDRDREMIIHLARHNWPSKNFSLFDESYKQHINVSGGIPLSSVALVSTFLSILRVGFIKTDSYSMKNLLMSPYIKGAEEEHALRSEWHYKADFNMKQAIIWKKWFGFLEKKQEEINSEKEEKKNSLFLECLEKSRKLFQEKIKKTLQGWYQVIEVLLGIWEWPHGVTLLSEEYQAWQKIQEILKQWNQLESFFQNVTYREAVELLFQMIHQHPYQSESFSENIQVLGLLEAQSLPFDALWLTGLNEEVLPEAIHPNPFIPFEIASHFSLPHADAVKEGKIAQEILEGFMGLSQQVILSWCERNADRHILPSPLINHFNASYFPAIEIQLPKAINYEFEEKEDYWGVPANTQKQSKKNSALLKDQSDCPFKAYIAHRLKAGECVKEKDTLSPQVKGQLLHKILELFWQDIKSQFNLKLLNDDDLSLKLEAVLEEAFIKIFGFFNIENNEISINKKYSSLLLLEKIRMKELILNWLDFEKKRAPFIVIATEKKMNIEMGGFIFSVRLDRIDKNENGEQIILDYKTGAFSKSSWEKERLGEPQLPFYALINEEALGILVCQIKLFDTKLIGIVCDSLADLFKPFRNISSKTHWQEQKKQWQQSIEMLISEFSLGYAAVTPRNKAICEYCDYASICRKSSYLI